jgi:hypothetical protein
MIELKTDDLIGRGRTRCCYRHPDDPDKCIKIDHRKHGGPTAKEAAYYRKLARMRPDFSYQHIPRFHGFVDTNLGKGGVFDLIRDETDGQISRPLNDYIHAGEVSADDPLWREAHSHYLKTLYDEAIIIRDFNPGNVCARRMRDGGYQLVTIDGIGHRDFIPLCDYFPWFARRKLRRQVEQKNFGSLEGILGRVEVKLEKMTSDRAERGLE